MSHHDLRPALDAVVAVAAEHAASVDREGRFPSESLAAMKREGLLGLVSATSHGGMGHGLRDAATVVEALGRACGSTAMVVCMHYAGALVIERFGDDATRREIARGELEVVLPAFSAMSSACSVGIMEAAVARSAEHASGARWSHAGQTPTSDALYDFIGKAVCNMPLFG